MGCITFRSSDVTKCDECPYAFFLYRTGVRPQNFKSNLVFGTICHDACTTWLKCRYGSGSEFSPAEHFREKWAEALNSKAIDFNSTMGPEDLAATGERLCEMFPEAWEKTNLIPYFHNELNLLVEVRFKVKIADNIILSVKPDVIALNPMSGKLVVVDLKTPASVETEEFVRVSDQLASQQIAVEGHAARLGLPPVEKVGFMDLLKRKVPKAGTRGKGPEIVPPNLSPRRTEVQVRRYLQKVQWMAEDVMRGRFPRRPRMAYNSPCTMCDYTKVCTFDDWSGLVVPDQSVKEVA